MAKRNSEPIGGPDPSRWYSLSLGNSFKRQNPSSKFCTLRYEFKPASIDKRQPGSLHKTKDNRVTVEFQNNQHGKPKVTFEGTSGDYNENDAVLFFNGESFVLERLHRGVKRLRHVRLLDESMAAAPPLPVASSGTAAQANSPPVREGSNLPSSPHRPDLQLIPDGSDRIGSADRHQGPGAKLEDENVVDHPFSYPNMSLDSSKDESEELVDIMNLDDDDNVGSGSVEKGNISGRGFDTGIDINLPHPADMDDEIADVDVSDEDAAKGPSAAEALRAQVLAEGGGEKSSSASTSSGSESSPSRSGSSPSSLSRSASGSRSGSSSDSDSNSSSDSSDSKDSDNVSVNSV